MPTEIWLKEAPDNPKLYESFHTIKIEFDTEEEFYQWADEDRPFTHNGSFSSIQLVYNDGDGGELVFTLNSGDEDDIRLPDGCNFINPRNGVKELLQCLSVLQRCYDSLRHLQNEDENQYFNSLEKAS